MPNLPVVNIFNLVHYRTTAVWVALAASLLSSLLLLLLYTSVLWHCCLAVGVTKSIRPVKNLSDEVVADL